jgi:hypothetical protein
MKKTELMSLLYDLKDYMEDRADAEGDSEGMRPNKEMTFLTKINDMLFALGDVEAGDTARASVDADYKPNSFEMNENTKTKTVLNENISHIKNMMKKLK